MCNICGCVGARATSPPAFNSANLPPSRLSQETAMRTPKPCTSAQRRWCSWAGWRRPWRITREWRACLHQRSGQGACCPCALAAYSHVPCARRELTHVLRIQESQPPPAHAPAPPFGSIAPGAYVAGLQGSCTHGHDWHALPTSAFFVRPPAPAACTCARPAPNSAPAGPRAPRSLARPCPPPACAHHPCTRHRPPYGAAVGHARRAPLHAPAHLLAHGGMLQRAASLPTQMC